MTRSADMSAQRMRRALLLVLALVALGVALFGALPASADSPSPSVQPTPAATPVPTGSVESPAPSPGTSPCPLPAVTPRPSDAPTPVPGSTPLPHALCPAVLSGNPVDLLAYLFNPIFQTLFLVMAIFFSLTGDIGIAIIVLTLLIKTLLIPLFRSQIVSQRRMQMVQPEVRAITIKYKGNRTKINEEQMRLYRERGVNPASGCLPSFLQLFLLLPIYSVINQGLAATDISSAMQFLTIPLNIVTCQAPGTGVSVPATDPVADDDPAHERPADPVDAADHVVPAADLDRLRLVPTGRPFHLLDRFHGILHSAAVPDRWVGITLPPLRLDASLRARSPTTIPGDERIDQALR